MNVREFITWLQTQDQNATVCVSSTQTHNERTEFDPETHVEILTTKTTGDSCLILGESPFLNELMGAI